MSSRMTRLKIGAVRVYIYRFEYCDDWRIMTGLKIRVRGLQ